MADALDAWFGLDIKEVNRLLQGPDVSPAAARAYNRMTMDMFKPYLARFAPVASIPSRTPKDAIAELNYVVQELGYKAIMLTVDTPVFGRRERDVRRGFTLPPKIGLETFVDGILHPKWTWDFVRSEPITFSAVAGRKSVDGSTAVTL